MKGAVLKYQKIDKNELKAQQAFITKSVDKTTVIPSDYNVTLGLLSGITYFLLFLYIYSTSAYKCNKIRAVLDKKPYRVKNLEPYIDDVVSAKKSIREINDDLLGPKNFTLSKAFKYSEKIGTVILIVATICFSTFYFNSQNINEGSKHIESNFIVFSLYLVLCLWILLFFLGPDKTIPHSILAFILILTSTISSYSIYNLYSKYYEEEGLIPLKIMSIISIISFLFLLVLVVPLFSMKNKYIQIIFSIFEIIAILSYSIFLIVCAFLPPIPNEDSIICKRV